MGPAIYSAIFVCFSVSFVSGNNNILFITLHDYFVTSDTKPGCLLCRAAFPPQAFWQGNWNTVTGGVCQLWLSKRSVVTSAQPPVPETALQVRQGVEKDNWWGSVLPRWGIRERGHGARGCRGEKVRKRELTRHQDFCSGCGNMDIAEKNSLRGRVENYKKEYASEVIAGRRDGEVATAWCW